jgi:heat shock protein HslJ
MKTLIKLFFLIVLLSVFLTGCSDTSESDASEDELETAIVTADKKATTIALIIEEVTAVTTPSIDNTPNYTFSSTKSGTITYGGSCSSSTTVAVTGNNTITLNTLSDGTYSNCTITVTDNAGNEE